MANVLETLNEIAESGVMKKLIACSLLPTTVIFQHEVLMYFDAQKKTTEKNTTTIVRELTDMYDVTEDCIYKIIRKLK